MVARGKSVDEYLTFDLNLIKSISSGLSLELQVKNLLDSDYYIAAQNSWQIADFLQPGCQVLVSLSGKL